MVELDVRFEPIRYTILTMKHTSLIFVTISLVVSNAVAHEASTTKSEVDMAINHQEARFIASYGTPEQLGAPTMPEVAFVGRSNVGKSSLLNALLGRKALAHVSAQPGKTANVNFFEADGICLVDLPGYGFARASKGERQRWADLISGYFGQERSFNLVVALVDIRHEAQALDIQMLDFLGEQNLPFVVALTKADKLSRSKQDRQVALLSRELGVARDSMVVTSAQTGQGIDILRACIDEAC